MSQLTVFSKGLQQTFLQRRTCLRPGNRSWRSGGFCRVCDSGRPWPYVSDRRRSVRLTHLLQEALRLLDLGLGLADGQVLELDAELGRVSVENRLCSRATSPSPGPPCLWREGKGACGGPGQGSAHYTTPQTERRKRLGRRGL